MMPFPGGLEAEANGLVFLSVAAAVIYGVVVEQKPSWRRTAAKVLGPLLLAYLAFVQGGPAPLVAALLFSAAGDAFLAHDGEQAFLGGLGSFLVAHMLYVGLFAGAGDFALLLGEPWRTAIAAALAAFCVVMVYRLWPVLEPRLRLPVLVYVLAILGMGIAALALPTPLVILGALLFIASDAILATEKFLLAPASPHWRWSSVAVWALYYLAQLLITLGVLLA